MLKNARTSKLHKPRHACLIASIVSLPIWFVVLLVVVNWSKPITNPAGIPIYAVICLALSIILLPINAAFIAPKLARLTFAKSAGAVVVHIIIGLAFFGLLWIWPSVIENYVPARWTMIPYYLSIFLIPPMIIGSMIYSLSYVTLNRQMNTVTPDSP